MFGGDGAVVKLAGLESDSVTIETLVTRFEQFYDESEVICGAAAEAFAARDYAELGRLVDESHRLTVEKLGNTIPETAWLPRWARGLEAAGGSDAARRRSAAEGARSRRSPRGVWRLVLGARPRGRRRRLLCAVARRLRGGLPRGGGRGPRA